MMNSCEMVLQLIDQVWVGGLVHEVLVVPECRHMGEYMHYLQPKPRGLVWSMFVAK